jgi:hypothetical protein
MVCYRAEFLVARASLISLASVLKFMNRVFSSMSRKMFAFFLQVVCSKFVLSLALFLLFFSPLRAQEPPCFVTYSDALEEPGNLEIAYKGVNATPKNANTFNSATLELEYGLKAWWTAEVYLSGQSTQNDSTVFTGRTAPGR